MARRIILKRDWDYQPKLGHTESNHITRKKEHSILVDFMARRDEGSLLVCGHRGVGKTSSVITAINDTKKQARNIIPILIKATSIDLDQKDGKKALLQSLIRFLHNAVKDNNEIADDLKKRTKKVHDNSLASEMNEEKTSDTTRIMKKTLNMRVKSNLGVILIILGLSYLGLDQFFTDLWVFSLAVIVLGAGLATYDFYKFDRKRNTDRSYYRHDYDFVDLQSEFEDLLKQYAACSKILFVLDELDKIGNLNSIIQQMKMLINQGSVLFIFITDTKHLKELNEKRGMDYTLFSQILFLKRPLFEEMESFIDDIVDNSNGLKDDSNYKIFKNHLCYRSQTDFFDLYRAIRDHVTGKNHDGNPIIEFSPNSIQRTQANLQKSIGWIYGRKKYDNPSQQQINDEMIDLLYEIIENMEGSRNYGSTNITFINGKLDFGDIATEYPDKRDQSIISDLLLFLTKQGYLSSQDESRYTIVGKMLEFKKEGIFVEEQRTFIEAYDKFIKKMVDFANIHSKWVKNFGVPFTVDTAKSKWESIMQEIRQFFDFDLSDANATYERLNKPESPLIATEILKNQIDYIRHNEGLLDGHYIGLLVEIFRKQLNFVPVGLSNITDYSDTTDDFFTLLEKERIDSPIAILNSQEQHANITNIVIIYTPSPDFLNTGKKQNSLEKNLVICLKPDSTSRGYVANNSLNELKMGSFFNSNTDLNIGFMPEKEPELPSKYKPFFLTMSIPLNFDFLEELLDILKNNTDVEKTV